MKRIFTALLGMAALAAGAQASTVDSQVVEAVYLTSISDNGQWIVGQADGEGFIYVKDLEADKISIIQGTFSRDGTGFTTAVSKAVSNNGVVVGLVNGQPFWWENGKWSLLPGGAVDGSAMVGSISADGSMIVGAIGNTGLSTEDILNTAPCIWYRNEDGSYGEPVFLPRVTKDPFGMTPQLLQAIACSEDGNVISVLMTSWSGFYDIPYIYTRGENGEWSYMDVGSKLLNPDNIEPVDFPGNFNLMQPNPEDYMTDAQLAAFWRAFPEWAAEEEKKGLPDWEQVLDQLEFMAEFMEGDNKTKYLERLHDYVDAAKDYNRRNDAYNEYIQAINASGITFLMNNSCVSPDGKYAYFTAIKTIITDPTQGEMGITHDYYPVRFDVATGEPTLYDHEKDLVLTSVAADYSILCKVMGMDDYYPTPGWIYPAGMEEGMIFPEFVQQYCKADVYDWMERNMYRDIIAGANDNGTLRYDEGWTVGLPYCSADLSIVAFGDSPMYWADSYYDQFSYVSFVLNTGMDVSGVECIGGVENAASVKVLAGGYLAIEGDVASVEVYDFAGAKVFAASNPKGVVGTGLQKGLYLITVRNSDGTTASMKAAM